MLGVPSSASEKELSRAYKKLAKEHHPDANAGQHGVRGALQGGERRVRRARRRREAQGVRRGPAHGRVAASARAVRRLRRPGGFGGGGQTFQFDVDFGDGGPAGSPTCSATCSAIAAGAAGAARRRARSAARISRPSCTCRSTTPCAASRARCGSAPTRRAPRATVRARRRARRPRRVRECHGSGSIAVDQGPFSFSQVCPTCGGRGQVIPTPCPTCHGRGVEMRAREVKVRVPAGVTDGQRIRVKGRGGGRRERRPGRRSLRRRARVQSHPLFGRSGNDLTIRLPVTFAEATLGADVKVPDARRSGDDAHPAGHTERQGDARPRPGRAGDGSRTARRAAICSSRSTCMVPDRARRRAARRGRGAAPARSTTIRGRRCSRSSTTEGAPMADTRALYVISVAAELAGVHPQTLRIYERKGLLGAGAHERPEPALLRPRHRAAAPHPGAHQRGHLARRRAADPRARAGARTPRASAARGSRRASTRCSRRWRSGSPPRTSSTGASSSRCATPRARARLDDSE